MIVSSYILRYKCIKHDNYQEVPCDTMREVYGLLGDMKRFLQDYNIITIKECKNFEC